MFFLSKIALFFFWATSVLFFSLIVLGFSRDRYNITKGVNEQMANLNGRIEPFDRTTIMSKRCGVFVPRPSVLPPVLLRGGRMTSTLTLRFVTGSGAKADCGGSVCS